MWWLLPTASAATGFFEPAPINRTAVMEVSGQTYRWGDSWLSGAQAFVRGREDRFHFGGHARALDDPQTHGSWKVHAATFTFGYAVVDEKRVDVMPYLRIGSHLQAGISARVALKTPIGRLVIDGSGGPVYRMPYTWIATPVPGIDAEPGLPEVGAALHFRTPRRPAVRVGMLGDQVAVSAQLGRQLTARAGVMWRLDESVSMGFFGVGVRI